MEIRVYFTPAEIVTRPENNHAHDVYIVIDVIRATTTMAVMLERHAIRIFAAENVEQAFHARDLFPTRLLCGERNAKPLPGFNYGNSPVEFSKLDLMGRELVLTTTNGTRAFYACPQEATLLAGCFYNAAAVTAHALQVAQQHDGDILLVCAGELNYFGMDDAACAGYLVQELQRQDGSVCLRESAQAAVTLYEQHGPSAQNDPIRWKAAEEVVQAGLVDDPHFCVQKSLSACVPMVVGKEEATGLVILGEARL